MRGRFSSLGTPRIGRPMPKGFTKGHGVRRPKKITRVLSPDVHNGRNGFATAASDRVKLRDEADAAARRAADDDVDRRFAAAAARVASDERAASSAAAAPRSAPPAVSGPARHTRGALARGEPLAFGFAKIQPPSSRLSDGGAAVKALLRDRLVGCGADHTDDGAFISRVAMGNYIAADSSVRPISMQFVRRPRAAPGVPLASGTAAPGKEKYFIFKHGDGFVEIGPERVETIPQYGSCTGTSSVGFAVSHHRIHATPPAFDRLAEWIEVKYDLAPFSLNSVVLLTYLGADFCLRDTCYRSVKTCTHSHTLGWHSDRSTSSADNSTTAGADTYTVSYGDPRTMRYKLSTDGTKKKLSKQFVEIELSGSAAVPALSILPAADEERKLRGGSGLMTPQQGGKFGFAKNGDPRHASLMHQCDGVSDTAHVSCALIFRSVRPESSVRIDSTTRKLAFTLDEATHHASHVMSKIGKGKTKHEMCEESQTALNAKWSVVSGGFRRKVNTALGRPVWRAER